MVFWENPLFTELSLIVKLNVEKLAKVIKNLEIDCQEKWKNKLKQEVSECCTIVTEEASFFVAIKKLREIYLDLCKSLHVTPLGYDEKNLSLCDEKKLLEERIEESRKEVLRRQNSLKELITKLKALAEPLQKPPIVVSKNLVPTEVELKRLSLEVTKLEKEHEEIKKNFTDLQLKIKTILQELNLQVRPQLRSVISYPNVPVSVCKATFIYLKKYYDELRNWQQKQEYEQLEALKHVINTLYSTCHMAQNERKINNNIHEHTLDNIQKEISELRKYYEENKHIFLLLAEYNQHWRKLLGFSRCFDRYSDEIIITVRKLCREICNVEIRLVEATICYEQKSNKTFTSFGETIPDLIAKQQEMCRKCDIDNGNLDITLYEIFNEVNDECLQSFARKPLGTTENDKNKNNTDETTTL